MADSLSQKRCVPCEGGVPTLTDSEVQALLPQVPGWSVALTEKSGSHVATLQKSMKFKNFSEAMTFLRKVEDIAEAEGHHPDFCVHYNVVNFTLWTHAIGGLHENDFILAAKIDALQHE
ncbi:MAG: 4a-hydroxytetrahydrobiopterin dehydratase [bacterium]|nr:4a-hydroxytetrahydrobiopterin dehydratase [bacterium]